jgi:hypothetical protein
MIYTGAYARAVALAAGYNNWIDAASYNDETGELTFHTPAVDTDK